MATNGNIFYPKKPQKFSCMICYFVSSNKKDYTRHLRTRKHSLSVTSNKTATLFTPITPDDTPSNKKHACEYCGKAYRDRTGLWRHVQKCIPQADSADLVLCLIKENKEFKQLLIEQNHTMLELANKNTTTTTTTTTMTNCNNNSNSNNKFNLNFFLNETCKDAMNIKDFIASLQLKIKDLEYTGENGYTAGITNIILRELNQLDICKRPIHCSDLKRETLHIKDENIWEKERIHLIKAIKEVTRKNVCKLQEWREAHPGCDKYHHRLNDHYLKLTEEALGPCDDDEETKCFNKIISKVAKATIIEKERTDL